MRLQTKTNPSPLNFKALYSLALRWLTRREHSVLELKNKLLTKTEDLKLIQEIINNLLQKKYLDDTRFAESYSRMRANKGYGSLKIKQELKERGITEVINLHQADIKKIFYKKFGAQPANKINNKLKSKQIRFLQYKGFSFEEIKKVMNHDEV